VFFNEFDVFIYNVTFVRLSSLVYGTEPCSFNKMEDFCFPEHAAHQLSSSEIEGFCRIMLLDDVGCSELTS
jgi:hypothetical protein